MGTAVTGSKLTGTYGEIAGREFNWLTPGNAMKWAPSSRAGAATTGPRPTGS